MAKNSEEPKLSLRLVVDEERKKVVFAEACSDFVDVLFSFLTLPMGTIVRLLEKHRNYKISCFSNLYKSVSDMSTENFETEACKEMLLNPRSLKDVQCKRLKLNLHPTEGDKYFRCPTFSSCKMYSNFSTSRCKCGELMSEEFLLTIQNVEDNKQNVEDNKQNDANGVFVRGKSSFIITDDLQVAVRSTDLVLKMLKSQGCGDFSKFQERLVDINLEEVMTLLQCIFSSNAPLTDTFLNKGFIKTCETLGPFMEGRRDESKEPEEVITLSVIVRKQDMKILYVECGQDFVDLLFTFLAAPLESVMENISTYGCIGNLLRSFKDLSVAEVSTHKSVLPHYYRCKNHFLNIITEKPLKLEIPSSKEPVVLIDPKSHGNNQSTEDKGSVKRDTKFTVTDDLIITPMNSSSAFCLLEKLQIQAKDLEVQEISITKTEATSLLRAALVTSSALNTALWNLIVKMPKEEETWEDSSKSTYLSCFSFTILFFKHWSRSRLEELQVLAIFGR